MTTDLERAMQMEASEINMDDLMAQMSDILGDYEGETNEKTKMSLDDYRLLIRRMMLAIQYLENEATDLKIMKKAVAAEWDRRIKVKTDQIDRIKDFIQSFLMNVNDKKPLAVDVGTVSLRRNAPALTFDESLKLDAEEFFKKHNQFAIYTKDPELDTKKVVAAYQKMIDDESSTRVQEVLVQMQADGKKITKKFENELIKTTREQVLDEYSEKLPAFMKMKEESYSTALSLTKPKVEVAE